MEKIGQEMGNRDKPQNSPLARLHLRMAGEKHWTIQELAEAMQLAAFKAQSANSDKLPQRASHEYIVGMLYGRKHMPTRWQIAAAKALGMSVVDYEKLRSAAIEEGQEIEPRSTILPIDYWPHFSWAIDSGQPRRIASLIYGLSREGNSPEFSIMPGQWQVPDGFSGYNELRNTAWQEFSRNYSRMKKEPPIPKPIWHVDRISLEKSSLVSLHIQQADFRDVLVTGNYQGLNFSAIMDDGKRRSVQDWLLAHWTERELARPVLPGACQLVVNLMVITKDGNVVLSRQGPDNPDSAGAWCPSVSTVINPKIDCDDRLFVDLARAVSRGCKEELGLEENGKGVKWHATAVGLKYGSICLFGALEVEYSDRQIDRSVAENVKLMGRDPSHVCQVTAVQFQKITSKDVVARLSICDYRPYLELGLALLLWKQHDAEILDGIVGETPNGSKKASNLGF